MCSCKYFRPRYNSLSSITHTYMTQDNQNNELPEEEVVEETKPTVSAQKISRFGPAGFQGGSKFGK